MSRKMQDAIFEHDLSLMPLGFDLRLSDAKLNKTHNGSVVKEV